MTVDESRNPEAEKPETEGTETQDKPAVSRRRKWVFRLIAVSIPFVLLLVAEVVCRLAGHGGYPPVLKKLGEEKEKKRGRESFWYAR